MKIEIIIADDHPIFLKGLADIISEDENIKIAGKATDGLRAVELINELLPAVAVLDIDMPRMDGLAVLKDASWDRSKTKIVFLTSYKEEDMFNEAIDNGAMGYVLKENALYDINDCINAVVSDKHYISPILAGYLVRRKSKLSELEKKQPLLKVLTSTDLKILKMIADDKTSKEIGVALMISYRTVENYRTNINNKLNLHGSHSLVKFAKEYKPIL